MADERWQPIETAPRDGSVVTVGKISTVLGSPNWPIKSRFLDGRWTCDFGGEWRSFDPQPTHWRPLPDPSQ